MNKLYKLGYVIIALFFAFSLSAGSVLASSHEEATEEATEKTTGAGAINVKDVKIDDTIGDIDSIETLVTFILNLFYFLGWVGVIVGVGLAIFALVYKLMNSDNEEAMQTVQGYLTKAVLIVIAGILLISAGFLIDTVTGFIPGFNEPTDGENGPGIIPTFAE